MRNLRSMRPIPGARGLWRSIVPFIALVLAYLAQPRELAAAPQVWFAPLDWFVRPEAGYGGAPDYMALFQPGPGQSILSHIQVLKLYPQFIQRASDSDLRTIFSTLERYHVSLAFEGGVLTESGRCGHRIEGFGTAAGAAQVAAKIKRLGGNLGYLTMDEPAFYGHVFSGPRACHESLAAVAGDAAKNVAALEQIFPQVRVGDGEPVGDQADASVIREYVQWADAFRTAAGRPLAFFQADIQWSKPWRGPLEQLSVLLKQRTIPLGIIVNGNDNAASDRDWIAQAMAHVRAVEADPKITVDQAVFQSWRPHPTHVFPVNDPGTFSYLLNWYFQQQGR